jgi:hypothetical protein
VKARFRNYESRVSERGSTRGSKRHGLPLQRTGKMTSPGKRPLLYPERGFNHSAKLTMAVLSPQAPNPGSPRQMDESHFSRIVLNLGFCVSTLRLQQRQTGWTRRTRRSDQVTLQVYEEIINPSFPQFKFGITIGHSKRLPKPRVSVTDQTNRRMLKLETEKGVVLPEKRKQNGMRSPLIILHTDML